MVSFARYIVITAKGLRPRGGLRICTKTDSRFEAA
jgi:hypothetical protein